MWLNLHIVLHKRKPYRSFLAAPDMISNVNSLAIVTSSICKPRDIVMSHRSIVLTLYLWTLSSSQWRCQPGRFSMAAHRHDRRGIYRCVLLRFRGRIEIDHSYGLRWSGLCCHCRHNTRGAGRRGRKRPRDGRPHSCCAGSGSTNHSSADRIVVNSYNHLQSFHYASDGDRSSMQRCSSSKVMASVSPISRKWMRPRGINARSPIFVTILLKDIAELYYHSLFSEEYVSLGVMIPFEVILKLLQITEW